MKRSVNSQMRVAEVNMSEALRLGGLLGRAALLFSVGSVTAFAHHSYAMFDMQKEVQVEGTVKEFRYTNPHSWIVLEVKDAAGNPTEYRVEANGPGYLARYGWKRGSLTPGDSVTVSVNPLKDGSQGGSLNKVTFKDGHELNAKVGAPLPTPAPGAKP